MVVNNSEFSSLLLNTHISEGLPPDLCSHVSLADGLHSAEPAAVQEQGFQSAAKNFLGQSWVKLRGFC